MSMPDFSGYTLLELEDAHHAVDREKHPDNYRAIAAELDRRRQQCAIDFAKACRVHGEGGLEAARPLLEQVVRTYGGTAEAAEARELLRKQAKNSRQEEKVPGLEELPEMKLAFNGSAREYFRIWIVNLSLTLLSCGIFSAWAKVRRKRYIYSHLTLDGTPFQYLGRPIPILKGRIIAALLFLVYYSSTNLFTPMLPYVFAAGAVLAPWVLVQSVAFNSRYTSFANMTFRFHGSYREAFKVLTAWGIIPVLIIGTMFDWWGYGWLGALLFALLALFFPFWLREIKRFIVTRTSYGGQFGQFGTTGGEFFKVYFLAGLIIAGFGIVTAVSAGLVFSVFEDSFRHMALVLTGVTYIGYIVSFAYIQAGITNAVWNRLTVGPMRFICTMSGTEMAKLYLTNIIGIVCSAGLLIPWAVIRTLRYRVEQTQVRRDGELSEFRASGREEVAAVGSELTDFLDLDLAI